MANNPKRTAAAANAAADAMAALCNGGTLRIYSGTQPASAATAASGTLLAELTLGSPAFGSASNGVATANAITGDTSADATGTAGWFRVRNSSGTAVFDGEVGTSGADLNLSSTSIQSGAEVNVTSLTITESMG